MTAGMKTVIFPVRDLAHAKTLYGNLLGVAPIVDEVYYVQFNVAEQEIGLDPNGHSQGLTGPIGYWHVADIDASLKDLTSAGAEIFRPRQDVGGRLIAAVKDADDNIIGLLQSA